MLLRRIGTLTIHFLGDNASQLAMMFDDAYYWSKSFRQDMNETSRTHRNIYVGTGLADLRDQPDFENAGFDPESKGAKESPAFGKAAGAETHFIVVKPTPHSLVHDGRRFHGTAQLALVHELLHPSQMIRELADSSVGSDTERETQKREQQIAIELRKVPGKDFPDVVGSGKTYGVPPPVEFQPNSPPLDDPELVAPIGYQGPARVQPKLPVWRQASEAFEFPPFSDTDAAAGLPSKLISDRRPDSAHVLGALDSRPMRYLSNRVAGKPEPSGFDVGISVPPIVPFGKSFQPGRPTTVDRFGGAPDPAAAFRDPVQPEIPLVGLVSGKPVSFSSVQPPIFDFPSASGDDENWLMRLFAPAGGR